ncbi:MAG: prenyltransferase/squalene oxidase repeat-containing protein [Planctomycetota bacterium]
MKQNILLVGLLIIVAGVIVALSFVMTPMPKDTNVQPGTKPAVEKSPVDQQGQPVGEPKPETAEANPVSSTPATDTTAQTPPAPQEPIAPPAIPTPSASAPPPPPPPVPPEQAQLIRQTLEQVFDKGLVWLMTQQLPSGSFPDLAGKDDTAFTSMALIILGEAPEPVRLKYSDTIDKALSFILKNVQENGSIMDPGKAPSFDIYKTSLAIVALKSIQHFRPQDKANKDVIGETISRAMAYLQKSQYGPESSDKDIGGWGYQEKGSEKTPNPNLSTTSYVIDALYKAGLEKDSETYKRAVDFLNKLQDSTEYNKTRVTGNSGGFVYSPTESKAGDETTKDGQKILKPYGSMTYAGLLSFIYAYVDKNDPRVQSAYNWIKANYTLEENPGLRTDAAPNLGKQGLFYYYHTFAKALSAYGEKSITTTDNTQHIWAEDLVNKLSSIQNPDGSWSNENARWWEDFPILATSYSLMSLNLCRKWVGE